MRGGQVHPAACLILRACSASLAALCILSPLQIVPMCSPTIYRPGSRGWRRSKGSCPLSTICSRFHPDSPHPNSKNSCRPGSRASRRSRVSCPWSTGGGWRASRQSGRRAVTHASQVSNRFASLGATTSVEPLAMQMVWSLDCCRAWRHAHPCAPLHANAEVEGSSRLRLQQAEMTWGNELQRSEARLGDAAEARSKLEAQVAALTQVGAVPPVLCRVLS